MLPRIHRAVAGLAVAVAATSPATTRADERAAPAALDEPAFLRLVIERSPRREALEARRTAERAQVAITQRLPNPTLGYEREAVPGLDASDDFLRLGWVLDLSGRRGLVTSAATAGADAESHDVDRDAFALESEARLAFLDALYARERVAALDTARTPLATLVEALISRAKQGDASSYDADRATLELDGLDDERATSRRSLEIARLRLGALIGEPATAYDARGSFGLPARPGPAQAPRRAEVDAAVARATQADREQEVARRKWIPRLELIAGVMHSTGMGGEGFGYVVGVGGDLPLFDRGGPAAARAQADAKRWRAEARALATEAKGEAEQARRELELRIDQAEVYLAGPAVRAADLLRRAGVAYREGDRPILELLDVQRAARVAAVRALELTYEARRAEIMLRRALGGAR